MIELDKKRQAKRRVIICASVATFLQMVVFVSLQLTLFKGFDFGGLMVIFMILINTSLAMVKINVVDCIIRPQNDPGILVWWLCCIRFGNKGKFKTEIMK